MDQDTGQYLRIVVVEPKDIKEREPWRFLLYAILRGHLHFRNIFFVSRDDPPARLLTQYKPHVLIVSLESLDNADYGMQLLTQIEENNLEDYVSFIALPRHGTLVGDDSTEEMDNYEIQIKGLLRDLEIEQGSVSLSKNLNQALRVYKESKRAARSARWLLEDRKVYSVYERDYFDPVHFTEALGKIKENFHHNKSLRISFDPSVSFDSLLATVGIENKQDLEELLGGLFYRDPEQSLVVDIHIENIVPKLSYNSTWVFRVKERTKTTGREGHQFREVVRYVKIGHCKEIKQEQRNYDEYINAMSRFPLRLQKHRAFNLAGLIYEAFPQDFQPLSTNFNEQTEEKFIDGLQKFFRVTCKTCYRRARNKQDENNINSSDNEDQIVNLYQDGLELSQAELYRIVDKYLPVYCRSLQINFPEDIGGKTYPNPLIDLARFKQQTNFDLCLTHGNLDARHIFIDSYNKWWVVDFSRSGHGHAFRDFTRLEASIKLELLEFTTLHEFFELENRLVQYFDWGLQQPETFTPPLAKGFRAIRELRLLASEILGPFPKEVHWEYYVSLFYNTLDLLRILPADKKLYAFLSSAMLYEKLLINRQQDQISPNMPNIKQGELSMSSPDPTTVWAIATLSKATDWLFTQTSEMLKEWREKRKQQTKTEESSAPESMLSDQYLISDARTLTSALQQQALSSAREMEIKQVESLMRQLEIHQKKILGFQEKLSGFLDDEVELRLLDRLDKEQSEVARKADEMRRILERLSGQSVRVPGLEE